MFAVAVVCVRVSKQTTMGTETTQNYDATRMCCCCRERVCVCVSIWQENNVMCLWENETNEWMSILYNQ